MVEFNEVQETILNFRAKRIANFKRVFPKLTVNNDEDSGNAVNTRGKASIHSPSGIKRRPKRGKVSQAVAPATMFMHMKGSNNADIILTVCHFALMPYSEHNLHVILFVDKSIFEPVRKQDF